MSTVGATALTLEVQTSMNGYVFHDYKAECMCFRCKGMRHSPGFTPPKPKRKRTVKPKVKREYIDPLDQGDNLGLSPDC